MLESEGYFDEDTREEPLSVSGAMARAKGALESFTVKLIGEVSELNNKPGYKAVYFSVKDEKATLPCMMWLNRYSATGVDMRVGMLVELTGRFTLYAAKGRMNFDVFSLAVAGEGDLRLKVANLAKKLQAEGLMHPERKKKPPVFPQKIGLVTSPRGAAVHDVLRTLRRRFPLAEIQLAGVAVEGENAARGLSEALREVESAGAEVILLVRGGGSFEDLMPFNDEGLARTIAAMNIPVITGIGHEPDTSIADMVSDVRASTPTAAAETVSPSREEVISLFESRHNSMINSLQRRFDQIGSYLERVSEKPLFKDSHVLFSNEMMFLDAMEERLNKAIPLNIDRDKRVLERYRERLLLKGKDMLVRFDRDVSLSAARLHDLSPLTILARGYAIAKNDEGEIIADVRKVAPQSNISVDIANGTLYCTVEEIEETSLIEWE